MQDGFIFFPFGSSLYRDGNLIRKLGKSLDAGNRDGVMSDHALVLSVALELDITHAYRVGCEVLVPHDDVSMNSNSRLRMPVFGSSEMEHDIRLCKTRFGYVDPVEA